MATLRPPKLGSSERLALYQGIDPETGKLLGHGVTADDDLEGVSVEIKFVGTEAADAFRQRIQANQLAEAKRLAELRKGFTAEQAPELFKASTPEAIKASLELVRDVLRDMAGDVHAPGEVLSGEDAQTFLGGLDMTAKTRLVALCLEAQGASRRQIFRPTPARVLPSDGPTDPTPAGQ